MQTDTASNDLFNLGIDTSARELLKTSATWAKIIAVVSFISAGVSILAAVLGSVSSTGHVLGSIGSVGGSLITAAITVSLNLFLFRFASNMSEGLANMNQQQFNSGASNLRTYFKFIGILMIIFISLFLLAMLFFIMGTGMSR